MTTSGKSSCSSPRLPFRPVALQFVSKQLPKSTEHIRVRGDAIAREMLSAKSESQNVSVRSFLF